jgi:hypothetical protein
MAAILPRDPDDTEAIAWSFWALLGQGQVEEAVALLDDGAYWVNTHTTREKSALCRP